MELTLLGQTVADPGAPRRAHPIQSLQVMRGLAAIMVAWFHTHVILAQAEYGRLRLFDPLGWKGWIGVNFFFVLSGFIILYAHWNDGDRPDRLGRYFARRFTRVYPIYWVLLTAYIAAGAAGLGHPDFKWEVRHLVSAYALAAIVDLPTLPLKVAWTLLFEVKFYILFATFLVSKRAAVVLFIGWGAAILLRNAFTPPPAWGYLAPDWGLLSIWNIYFLIGMLACLCLPRVDPRLGPWVLLAGLAMLLASGSNITEMAQDSVRPPLMLALGLSFSLIILGAAVWERESGWRPPGWARLLGDASYAIYLVHSAVISQVAGLNNRLPPATLPTILVFAAAFLGAVAAGVMVHLMLERPLLQLIRGWRTRAGATRMTATADNI